MLKDRNVLVQRETEAPQAECPVPRVRATADEVSAELKERKEREMREREEALFRFD